MNALHRPVHKDVRITNGFWRAQLDKIRTITVPDILEKFEQDGGHGVMRNYEWVAAGETGRHVGPPWYDGLICEVIRGVSDLFAHAPDPAMEALLDRYADTIAAAQAMDPSGYVNTYGTLICPDNRWGENGGSLVWQHETYNLGCLVEAGIHYWRATGKTRLLDCGVRAANCMCAVMGPAPRKNIIPAHSLAEEAMVKLYQLFRDHPGLASALSSRNETMVDPEAYLSLAVFWNDQRGRHADRASHPHYMGEYAQDHCPVCQQSEAVGHAVRAALLYTGLVASGIAADRQDFLDAARRLWDNAIGTKMHVSGGIGAVRHEERFGFQYDLPNDAYLETCAGVALAFWAGEMHRAFKDASYMDVFERALYNNVLPGLSADGTRYFYENPLVSGGGYARWEWHACPCCPPMFLKLMGSLPDYIYSRSEDTLFVNLHVGSEWETEVAGIAVRLCQEHCGIPWTGRNEVVVDAAEPVSLILAVRIPEWAGTVAFALNGAEITPDMCNGYACFKRTWKTGDVLRLDMEMPAVRVEAHPYVKANLGRVALMRGPLLYCVEGIDNDGETELLLGEGPLAVAPFDLCGPVVVIRGALADGGCFTAVPYYLWNNRGDGKMAVWLRQAGMPMPESISNGRDDFAAHHVAIFGKTPDLSGWENRLYRTWTQF